MTYTSKQYQIVLEYKENFVSNVHLIWHILQIKYQKKSFLATIISTLKKPTKFSYKNTTPGEQKGEAIVFSVQQPLT